MLVRPSSARNAASAPLGGRAAASQRWIQAAVDSATAGAGSAALRALLDGPPATGAVVHAGHQAVYADLGGPDPEVVGVLARGAVHVPCAVLTALPSLPEVAVGDPVVVGDGVLRIGALSVAVTRLVSFALPRLGAAPVASDADLAPARDQLPADALDLLAAGDPAAVPALVGRGDGLTPVGDDVLAGWLVATRAVGRDCSAVATAVRAHLPRTTGLSAALLRHAIAGEAIAPFRTALATGEITGLLAVGHTSGAGMLLGARLALSTTINEALEGSTR
ncbi:oxamate carbamoyltransferase subunit AllH family protein [Nocardioides nitrophenolicus]|uniref:oxamate carbamoyltransferase subunit AllH family protein n=1 Tax=Nocardioides nitrophenolicus TaxID=60489 RepID=UPI00195D8EBF|nr:DUF2877 domain-containing protein [Nocardioides nitrophenolicus]MBM7519048.1 hypothetical protein [Nocardioides nitrophenolicus]